VALLLRATGAEGNGPQAEDYNGNGVTAVTATLHPASLPHPTTHTFASPSSPDLRDSFP